MATAVAPTERGFASARVQDTTGAAAELDYGPVLNDLRAAFRAGKAKSVEWRKQQLRNLIQGIKEMHEDMIAAVNKDLGGPRFRGVVELTPIDEAEFALAHIDEWVAPRQAKNNFLENPNGSAEVVPSPKGVVLLISPWNYPISLCLKPLVAIIAAGNCCVIKPSEVASHSAEVTKRLIEKYLDPACFRVILGGVAETTALLRERYAHIVYTGNGDVARIIMGAAAKNLTPCTLELGGKSPVIVDSTANLEVAARRVAFGKWAMNAGQTCIAPDYVLVDRKLQDTFVNELKGQLKSFYAKGPASSSDYGQIINSRHVGRLQRVLAQSSSGEVVEGDVSSINADRCFVPPIIIKDPSLDDAVMREEIFGPILPVVAIDNVDQALDIVQRVCPRPLAFYQFSEDTAVQQHILDNSESGAMVVNGCNFEQYSNSNLPFGGVGESGTGQLHGLSGFNQVSHLRAVVRKSTSFPFTKMDLPPPPYSDKMTDTVLKAKYTGFMTPQQSGLIKAAGLGALLLAGAAALRSRL